MTEPNFLWFLSVGMLTAFVHALLPNHWFPFVAAARLHGWTNFQLFRWTLLTAIAHATVTMGLGIAISFLGEGVAHFLHENSVKVAGITLIALALAFLLSPRLYGHKHIHHPECEHCAGGSQIVTLTGLFLALTFSPCEGLLPVFFAAAVKLGWLRAFLIASLNSLLTVSLLVTVSLLAHMGWERFLPRLKEHHERLLTSGLLAVLGVALVSGLLH